MEDFVQTRLNPVLNKPYYSSIVNQDMNSIKVKQIRNSFLNFRTSSKPGTVEGLDADYVSLDEYDRVPAASEQSALNAMKSSSFKIFRRWSTPTIPNMGIHDAYMHSDQFVYMHKCTHCGYWNELNYDDYDSTSITSGGNIKLLDPSGIDPLALNVAEGTYDFVCQKCGKHLDRWYNGTWVNILWLKFSVTADK